MSYKENKLCNGVQLRSIEELEKLHTKQLLKLRYDGLPLSDWYCRGCCCAYEECDKNNEINRHRVREVLATRPHIPNKQESKAIRKARIQKGK